MTKELAQGQYKAGDSYFSGQGECEEAVKTLLRYIGQNPDSDALKDTPRRVVRAFAEMTAGYYQNPADILGKTFPEPCDEMVVLRDIEFTSICEHHLLTFTGTVDIGYIPGKVVGLSKLARLVDCFSKRLQMQERMTRQIAGAIEEYLESRGTAVVVRGRHACMGCRGVMKPDAEMVTSSMLGVMRTEVSARAEFLSLCR